LVAGNGNAIEASTGAWHHCWSNKLDPNNDRQKFTIRAKSGGAIQDSHLVGFEKDGWYAYPAKDGWLGLKPEPYYWTLRKF